MKRILVPTDFSINAGKALDFAIQIAKRSKGEIILVHACDLAEPFRDELGIQIEHNKMIIDEANEKLYQLKENIEETEEITIQPHLYEGSVNDCILQASEDYDVDLIVMGTLGNSGIKEKIFGSKTAWTIGKSDVPVIAVPLLSQQVKLKKVLLAVNHFEEEPGITNPLFKLAGLFDAKVEIAIFTNENSAEAIDYLEHARGILGYEEKLKSRYKNIDIKGINLDGHHFQETLNRYIDEQGINILAMVTHKRTLIESIFSRSMTKKMSYHSKVPLLAIPADT